VSREEAPSAVLVGSHGDSEGVLSSKRTRLGDGSDRPDCFSSVLSGAAVRFLPRPKRRFGTAGALEGEAEVDLRGLDRRSLGRYVSSSMMKIGLPPSWPSYLARTLAGVLMAGGTVCSHRFVDGKRHTAVHLTTVDASELQHPVSSSNSLSPGAIMSTMPVKKKMAVASDAGSTALEFSLAMITLTNDASEKAVSTLLEAVKRADPDTKTVSSMPAARGSEPGQYVRMSGVVELSFDAAIAV